MKTADPLLVQQIAIEAGREILKHYRSGGPVTRKEDSSPLTAADLASHRCICANLRALDSSIPILSEESSPEESALRSGWSRYWLVDPLDGTKEFLKESGEFTVNIALIEDHESVMGIVHAPAIGLTYWGHKGGGAFKHSPSTAGPASAQPIRATPPAPTRAPRIVASRDHRGPMIDELLRRFPSAETLSMGSSLKFCLIAEGQADIYLRDQPTMEWDTAAAQCIVEAAGGVVTDLEGRQLRYNKPDLRNPPIITLADATTKWR